MRLVFYLMSTALPSRSPRLQGYPFPLSITMIHLVVKFLIAWVVRKLIALVTGEPPLVLGWREYMKNITPVGRYTIHVRVHVVERRLECRVSWVRVPPEAAHFF